MRLKHFLPAVNGGGARWDAYNAAHLFAASPLYAAKAAAAEHALLDAYLAAAPGSRAALAEAPALPEDALDAGQLRCALRSSERGHREAGQGRCAHGAFLLFVAGVLQGG